MIVSVESPLRFWQFENIRGNRREIQRQLLVPAINYIESRGYIPKNLLIDSNGDGAVDNVTFIIRNFDPDFTYLTNHKANMGGFGATINGKLVDVYNFNWERAVSFNRVALLAHEFTHSLGENRDYIHHSGFSWNPQPIGRWCNMALLTEPLPASMSSVVKRQIGWLEIPEIVESGRYTLSPLSSTTGNRAFRINSPNSDDEYFILEYRRNSTTVIDFHLPGSGLLVYRFYSRGQNESRVMHDRLYAYRPTGNFVTPYGDTPSWRQAYFSQKSGRTAINSTTEPRPFLKNGELGWLDISDIEEKGDTIEFYVHIPPRNSIISSFPHTESFSSIPDFWTRATSSTATPMNANKVKDQSWSDAYWSLRNFANVPNHPNGRGISALFRNDRYWLITPELVLPSSTHGYALSFDIAMTTSDEPNQAVAIVNEQFYIIVSRDNGETWSTENRILHWDHVALNRLTPNGTRVFLNLTDFRESIKIAFIVEGQSNSFEARLHIDNFSINIPTELSNNVIIQRTGARFPTIQSAVDATINNDTILIDGNLFAVPGNYNIHWPTNRNINIRGNNHNNRPIIDGGGHPVFIMTNRNNRNAIYDIEIRNANPAIQIVNSFPSIHGVVFRGNHRGIYINNPPSMTDQVLIANCDFINNSSPTAEGISIRAMTRNLKIENSTFYDNRGSSHGSIRASGASLYFEGNVLELSNNRFENNSAGGQGANIMIKRREDNNNNETRIAILNNRFINNRSVGSLQSHNISIMHGYRFKEIEIYRNVFHIISGIAGNMIPLAPSIAVLNNNQESLSNITTRFRYINNTSITNRNLNTNQVSDFIRDLQITMGSEHYNFPVDIQNSVFTGGILLWYTDSPNDFPNRVRIRNSWFANTPQQDGRIRIRGRNPSITPVPIYDYIFQREGIMTGVSPHIDPDTYRPIWTSTTKSPLINAGHRDTNRNGIPWWDDPGDRNPDGTRLDIGAIPSYSHSMIAHTIVPSFEVNWVPCHTYAWVSFPYIDNLFTGDILADGKNYKADDLIYNLHHAFDNRLFDRGTTVSWRTNDDFYSFSYNDFSSYIPNTFRLDRNQGYKIRVGTGVGGRSGVPAGTPAHIIETAGFFYSGMLHPGPSITLKAKEPGAVYKEVWLGYHSRTGEHVLKAFELIEDYLIEIKTRNWAISRWCVYEPWTMGDDCLKLTFGEAISVKFIGEQDRTFTWSVSEVPPEIGFIDRQLLYFYFREQADFIPVFVRMPFNFDFDNGGEIGIFINGQCFGAAIVRGEMVQINAYVLDLINSVCDLDDLDIEFRFHEYGGSRSSEELTVRDFKVLDHASNTFVSRSLDLNSNKMFFVISLRDDEEYIGEDNDIPVISYVTSLRSNFPNPFNPETAIQFTVGTRLATSKSVGAMSLSPVNSGHEDMSPTTNVKINVYNVRGQRVRTLLNEYREPGHHSIVWNGRDDSGRALSSGIYLYRMTAGDFTETRRMLLMK